MIDLISHCDQDLAVEMGQSLMVMVVTNISISLVDNLSKPNTYTYRLEY